MLSLRSCPSLLLCALMMCVALVGAPLLCAGWLCAFQSCVSGQDPVADNSDRSHESIAGHSHHSEQPSECSCADAVCTCHISLNRAYSYLVRGQDVSHQDISDTLTASLETVSTHFKPSADLAPKRPGSLIAESLLKLRSVILIL